MADEPPPLLFDEDEQGEGEEEEEGELFSPSEGDQETDVHSKPAELAVDTSSEKESDAGAAPTLEPRTADEEEEEEEEEAPVTQPAKTLALFDADEQPQEMGGEVGGERRGGVARRRGETMLLLKHAHIQKQIHAHTHTHRRRRVRSWTPLSFQSR